MGAPHRPKGGARMTLENFTPLGERGGTKDTRLIARAVRERWPIPDELRSPIVKGQAAIALNPKETARDRTRAADCLRRMDHENMLAEGVVSDQPPVQVNVTIDQLPADERRLRLDALARRLDSGDVAAEPAAGAESADPQAASGAQASDGTSGEQPA